MNKKEIQELIKKAQSGDEEAKLILVKNHMDLVWSVVHKFGHLEVEKDDLFQIGCMGLLKAIIQFDASYDTTLSTYAIPLIIGEIKAFIREQSPIKISRSIKSNIHKIQEVKDQLNKSLEREPTIKELAEATELTEEQIKNGVNNNPNISSNETAVENTSSFGSLMPYFIATICILLGGCFLYKTCREN